MSFDLNVQNGWGKVTRRFNMLNTQQYIEMRKEAIYNDSVVNPQFYVSPDVFNAPDLVFWDTTRNTDWQRKLIGNTAQFTNLNMAFFWGNQPCKIPRKW